MSELFFASAARDEHGQALLTLTIDSVDGHRVISAHGEIDISTADLLTACGLRELSNEPGSLTLELSGVTFFSAAGVRALLMLRREAGDGTRLELRDPSPHVRLVLDLCDMPDVSQTPPEDARC